MKIVFLNGPKGSGKDETVKLLEIATKDDLITKNIVHLKFAQPLFNTLREMFCLDPNEWDHMYNNHKEEQTDVLYGMSPREAMIWLSEKVIKPNFGKNYFGNVAVNKINSFPYPQEKVFIFSDSGFFEEAKTITDAFTPEICYYVKLMRHGKTFDGDSRSYWNPKDANIPNHNCFILENNGSKNDLMVNASNIINNITGEMNV